MTSLQPSDFSEFFQAVHGHQPFPWQRMLVERVAARGWPEGIDLPTASGKTACIDIAVFLLALGAEKGRLPPEHPGRRRVFFVVDRRIVVDEAYERASRLAQALESATGGPVGLVADRLRELAGSDTPLVVSRLRGGTLRDEAWRLSPTQPAVVTSTVDQVGSRLLFRSYGAGVLSAPIEASLVGCDSLVLLDEAHCAVPFLQTARAVRHYAGPHWTGTGQPLAPPMVFSILSATLPDEVQDIFPQPSERDAALDSPVLRQRVQASKNADLVEAKKPRQRDWSLGDAVSDDDLVLAAAQRAVDIVGSGGHARVAVMVNRVARATAISHQLRSATEAGHLDADIVLMTGRMRPVDRDELVARWSPFLRAVSPEEPARPIVLVTTQCLEVGADFSFDALITECASLDALRQRFGRLNRLGDCPAVAAAVLVRKADVKPDERLDDDQPLDPVYGNALARTWNWLAENASEGRFDFGIAAVNALLPPERADLAPLLAPSPDAPILLPAHVDFLCQTAPTPVPDPDVSVFLHGPDRSRPEARIVLRADLGRPAGRGWRQAWADAVSLLPPVTAEALPVPLYLVRRWLSRQPTDEEAAEIADVEGQRTSGEAEETGAGRPFVIWRGRRDTRVSTHPSDIRPNDTIVVPADEEAAAALGPSFTRPATSPLDVAEMAYPSARQRYVLRAVPSVLAPWTSLEPVADLLAWARDEERDAHELPDLLRQLAEHPHDAAEGPSLPAWLAEAAEALARTGSRIEPHPAGGVLLLGPPAPRTPAHLHIDLGDADDTLSATDEPVPLDAHARHVLAPAQDWAQRCLDDPLAEALATAARLHDLGKADQRFQIFLHGDEVAAAVAIADGQLLAKSPGPDRSPSVQVRINGTRYHLTGDDRRNLVPPHRIDSGIPERFWRLTRRYGWWGLAYLEAILRLADRAASAAEAAPQHQAAKGVSS